MGLTWVILRNDFPSLPAKARGGAKKGVFAAADRIQAAAQSRAKVDTGTMRESVTVEGAGDAAATVNAGAPYSGFLDMGTRYIPADRWFSGAAQDEAGRFGDEMRSVIAGALG